MSLGWTCICSQRMVLGVLACVNCQSPRYTTMNHSFHASHIVSDRVDDKFPHTARCITCNRPESDHTDSAECEICGTKSECIVLDTILMCQSCAEKQPVLIESKTDAILNVSQSRAIDASIETRADFFNAATVAIVDLEKSILSDESIPAGEKQYTIAKEIQLRMSTLRDSLFKLDEERLNKGSELRAMQVRLNDLASKLRAEERERLKISDISYKPQAPKLAKTPTAPKIKKFDKTAIRTAAKASNIPEYMIQLICTQKNVSPETAVNLIQGNIKETVECSCKETPGLCKVHNMKEAI